MNENKNFQEQKDILDALYLFYSKRHLWDKAFEVAELFMEMYPSSYHGKHLQLLIKQMNQDWNDIRFFFESDFNKVLFEDDEEFWEDWLNFVSHEKGALGITEFLKEHMECRHKAPSIYYQKKFGAAIDLRDFDEIQKLSEEYLNIVQFADEDLKNLFDAIKREDYLLAGNIANHILERESNSPGTLFYTVLQLQCMIIIMASEGDLTDEEQEFLDTAASVLLAWQVS